MKRFQIHALMALLLCVSLGVAACSSGGGGGGAGAGGAPTVTAAPSATPRPKPTAIPKITVAFCQNIMTVAQANQFMHPPTPATTIRVDAPASGGGSCNYEYKPFHAVVSVVFPATVIDVSNPQAVFAVADKQLPQSSNVTMTTAAVSGVGDAAQFVTSVLIQPPLKMAALQVIYGKIFFTCSNFNVQGSSFTTQQGYLTQVCQQYVSQL
ncbi:MAG TPA: hypothetical protein VE338_07430 [Ktedonobacterales bacterium]|jgi:hypothetical protein|nr:hypothetical protein [Ktedonobacterales bacterium]